MHIPMCLNINNTLLMLIPEITIPKLIKMFPAGYFPKMKGWLLQVYLFLQWWQFCTIVAIVPLRVTFTLGFALLQRKQNMLKMVISMLWKTMNFGSSKGEVSDSILIKIKKRTLKKNRSCIYFNQYRVITLLCFESSDQLMLHDRPRVLWSLLPFATSQCHRHSLHFHQYYCYKALLLHWQDGWSVDQLQLFQVPCNIEEMNIISIEWLCLQSHVHSYV